MVRTLFLAGAFFWPAALPLGLGAGTLTLPKMSSKQELLRYIYKPYKKLDYWLLNVNITCIGRRTR